jgi:hypothetical protein
MSVKVRSRSITAKVVVFHDFDFRRDAIINLFRLSEEHAHQARYIAQQMCDDLLVDIAELRNELNEIETFCRRELQRPYPTE